MSLLRILFIVATLVLAEAVHFIFFGDWHQLIYLILATIAGSVVITWIAEMTNRGAGLREVAGGRLAFEAVFALLLLAVSEIVRCSILGDWPRPIYLIGGALVGSYVLTGIAGNASRGVALRKVIGGAVGSPIPNPPDDMANAKRWYIESVSVDGGLPQSCSFVEFDERGDYLDFYQHVHAYEKIQTLANEDPNLIVVIFVHGWRNNTHSGNVISFNEFLHQLATFTDGNGRAHRVHGVYLSWRGACLKHAIDQEEPTFKSAETRFPSRGPIVDLEQAARFPRFNEFIESLSYFDRKGVPEHLFSATSLSRTLFTCAHVAKRYKPKSNVFLIGHSFGGLMLERTFQNATIGELVETWPWEDKNLSELVLANPLPFDTVLLVNSAAPSIYAKQLQSFLAAHHGSMVRSHVKGANAPVFFSLTSSGDSATGELHPLANTFCFLIPTLHRDYKGNGYILAEAPAWDDVSIPQSYYYRHTPGHNPLLVNRFIEEEESASEITPSEPEARPSRHLHANLQHAGSTLKFTTSSRVNSGPMTWSINFPPITATFNEFSWYKADGKDFRPVVWQQDSNHTYVRRETAYWIVRCTKDIIQDHNDIWSQQAMDTYAALYSIAVSLREQSPGSSTAPRA